MIVIRKSAERGHFNHGWLETYHTFSFDRFRDPRWNGFRTLRVLNEDFIQPGGEFPAHPHRNMEIITYMISGQLSHKDNMGNGSTISPGEVQWMSAGSGVTHSETNTSRTELTHLLQIWIRPHAKDLTPEYGQTRFPGTDRKNGLCLIASGDGRRESLKIHQDASVFASLLESGRDLSAEVSAGRYAYLHLISGSLTLSDSPLSSGDGAAISSETYLSIKANERSEFLLFDLG
ncbi:MAG: pirin family protein [Candidatus Zixiibacteriota bacterium]